MNEENDISSIDTQMAEYLQEIADADNKQDFDRGYELRLSMANFATTHGFIEQMIMAVSWCLGMQDKFPDRWDYYSLLWDCKWMAEHIPNFPGVSRSQIEELNSDLHRRYESYGSGMRAMYGLRRDSHAALGDKELAREFHVKHMATPRDLLSDCRACEAYGEVLFLHDQGQDEAAIKEALKQIADRSLVCNSVPQANHALLLILLLKYRRVEEAMSIHVNKYRMVANKRGLIHHAIKHMYFLVKTENYSRALSMFEKHYPFLSTTTPNTQMRFQFHASLLFKAIASQSNRKRKVRLPSTFELHQPDGLYDTARLAEYFEKKALELVAQFDARNGNPSQSQYLKLLAELPSIPHPYPTRSRKNADETPNT